MRGGGESVQAVVLVAWHWYGGEETQEDVKRKQNVHHEVRHKPSVGQRDHVLEE
jgi:hypothetical protein